MEQVSKSPSSLQLFRTTVQDFLKPNRFEICSKQQYQQLCEHLCNLKLLRPSQAKMLCQFSKKIAYPVTTKQFQLIIMKQFADYNSSKLLNDLKQMQTVLRDTKGILMVWKQKGLTKQQIKQLESIFAQGNDKMKQVCKHLSTKRQILDSISEQQLQIVSQMNEWVEMQNIHAQFKDFQDFQNINCKTIDNIYNQIRVRQVHFKKKISKKQSSQTNKIVKVTAMNSKNDQPVIVHKIPKYSEDLQTIDSMLTSFNAYYQLMLSQYFPKFLGSNTSCDSDYFYYFTQYTPGENLSQIISNSKIQLEEVMPIFMYWSSCLFSCLKDLYQMCGYEIVMPIHLDNFIVMNGGLKIMLENAVFGQQRVAKAPSQKLYQAKLLKNLGTLILQLLKINQNQISSKIKKNQNKCLLSALLNADKMLENLESKRTSIMISFFNCQTHPLFESTSQLNMKIILENYSLLRKEH